MRNMRHGQLQAVNSATQVGQAENNCFSLFSAKLSARSLGFETQPQLKSGEAVTRLMIQTLIMDNTSRRGQNGARWERRRRGK